MNAPVIVTGLALFVVSIVGETLARNVGLYGIALVLELLFLPAIIVLVLGVVGGTQPPDRGETAAPLPDDATAPEF